MLFAYMSFTLLLCSICFAFYVSFLFVLFVTKSHLISFSWKCFIRQCILSFYFHEFSILALATAPSYIITVIHHFCSFMWLLFSHFCSRLSFFFFVFTNTSSTYEVRSIYIFVICTTLISYKNSFIKALGSFNIFFKKKTFFYSV